VTSVPNISQIDRRTENDQRRKWLVVALVAFEIVAISTCLTGFSLRTILRHAEGAR
jgi:hypothetical protein